MFVVTAHVLHSEKLVLRRGNTSRIVVFNFISTLLYRCYIWGIATDGAETWTLRKVDPKYLESVEMWC